jgi:predicted DNA-binding protein (MmcQ/YjbR family)
MRHLAPEKRQRSRRRGLASAAEAVQVQGMTRDEFNRFCGGLKATNHVVQWGNSDVWKVGPKLFAVCGWNEGRDAFTFKVSDIAFEVLGSEPGIRPAPYLASRGMKWLQVHEEGAMSEASLREHIMMSYDLVVAGMTKKMRAELGVSAGSIEGQ